MRCFRPKPKFGATCICACSRHWGITSLSAIRSRIWRTGGTLSRSCATGAGIRRSSARAFTCWPWTAIPRCSPGSDQARWIEKQIDGLPSSIDFVIVTMHHPPVADVQTHIEVDHNPRPNEIALRDYLSQAARTSHASFLVSAGHIHNYERNVVDGVTYLVSGGGGAPPYFVERTPEDLYKSILFPNYHYVKLTLEKDRLHGAMYRVENPEAETLNVELKDSFDLQVKPR